MFSSIFKTLSNAVPLLNTAAKLFQAGSAFINGRRQEKLIKEQTRRDVERRQRDNQRLLASQRARYTAAGVTLDGTANDVLGETNALAQRDISRLRSDGRQSARAARNQGRDELIGGSLSGAGTLLGGYDDWIKLF